MLRPWWKSPRSRQWIRGKLAILPRKQFKAEVGLHSLTENPFLDPCVHVEAKLSSRNLPRSASKASMLYCSLELAGSAPMQHAGGLPCLFALHRNKLQPSHGSRVRTAFINDVAHESCARPEDSR